MRNLEMSSTKGLAQVVKGWGGLARASKFKSHRQKFTCQKNKIGSNTHALWT